ncbi:MAG: hypothetical protein MI924_13995 [Chloroflexales bacterium]|nr:hypothetical protein [Chloroflexales bacterium]
MGATESMLADFMQPQQCYNPFGRSYQMKGASMSAEDIIELHFDDIVGMMRLKFQGWEQDLPHQGEKGGLKERRVADFIRSFLPQKYGLGTGHVIDSEGNTSGQADIVIYDTLNDVKIPIDEYYSLFPCESVYAIIEVKSTLTASFGEKPDGTIEECIGSATKFKSLNRRVNGNFEMGQHFVFAYQATRSNDHEKTTEWFRKLAEDRNAAIPDMVLVLNSEYVLCNYDTIDLSRYSHVFKRAPLVVFISEMIRRLSTTNTETPDVWQSYLRPRIGEVITTIYQEDGNSYDVKPLVFRPITLPRKKTRTDRSPANNRL